MKKKYLFISTLLVLIALGLFKFFKNKPTHEENPYNCDSLILNNQVDTLYIRARVWGVSGNHTEILISNDRICKRGRPYNEKTDYIFRAPEIYYKIINDTLIVYSESITQMTPENFSASISIKQNKLKDYYQIQDYTRNYKKYGLKKVSVYPANKDL